MMMNSTSKKIAFLALALFLVSAVMPGVLNADRGDRGDSNGSAPVITLVGSNPLNILSGLPFVDPGATAIDPTYGDISSSIQVSGSLDANTPGTYTLTYNVTNQSGISATPVIRTVIVSCPTEYVPGCNCRICPVGHTYDPATGNCVSICPAGQQYDPSTNQCVVINQCTLPSITSSLSVSGRVGESFYYAVTGSNVNSYNVLAMSLPTGLSFSNSNGVISIFGTPLQSGNFSITVRADNTCGMDTETISIVISTGQQCLLPQITSSLTASATIGQAFSYTLTASSTATTTLSVSSLPAGLSFATSTKTISGTPTQSGTFNVTLSATNQCGTDSKTLVLTVNPGQCTLPSITSALSASGRVGETFSYTFTAQNATLLSATSTLPAGLSYATSTTGVTISGTPTQSGTFSIGLSAKNSCGSDYKVLVVTIEPAPQCLLPQITSSLTASATIGQAFSYTLTASSTATTTLSVSSLPAGLSFATSTKTISGTPTQSGTFNVTLSATNQCGTDSKTLVLTVNPGQCTLPSITSALSASGKVGQAFSYVFSASNVGSYSVSTSTLPAGLVFSGNIISGTPSVSGTFDITLTATNSCGNDVKTLRITIDPSVPVVNTGKIKLCLLVSNNQNVLATSPAGLPQGTFVLNLATSTTFATSTIFSRTWDSTTFAPNTKIVLNADSDADCVVVEDLPFGTYYYSQVLPNGSLWNTPKYSDQETQPINNVFDFSLYATTSPNSDGVVTIDSSRDMRTVAVLVSYNPAPQCLLPQITSSLTASATIGQAFSYTLTASSTATTTLSVSSLPAGLSFATSTNTISGTPTQTGTFNVSLSAENSCGIDVKTLVISVSGCSGTCGGGGSSSDLSVVKTADKNSVNSGDTVTYTITAKNEGLDTAKNVTVTDAMDSGLSLVSATSTIGTFSTSTMVWTIGDMQNGASATLTIVATVSGSQGQNLSNTATITTTTTDPNSSNNTSTVTVSIPVPPACTSNCGGGGGGGGGGNGPVQGLYIYNEQVTRSAPGMALVTWNTNIPASSRVVYGNSSISLLGLPPQFGYATSSSLYPALSTYHTVYIPVNDSLTYYFRPVSTTTQYSATGKELTLSSGTPGTPPPSSCYYLRDYLRRDFNNDPVEVKKLQIFLRDLEGYSYVPVNGVYDETTIAAVNAFQIRYAGDVLLPWGYEGNVGTDYTYILTKKKVNEIYCKTVFPVSPQQQQEIDATRALFESLRKEGININSGSYNLPGATTTSSVKNVIGQAPASSTVNSLSTLAGVSSTTNSMASKLTANILSAFKGIGGMVKGIFPATTTSCTPTCQYCGWLNWILLAIIVIISILWYREYRNNRKLKEINEEIDLQK